MSVLAYNNTYGDANRVQSHDNRNYFLPRVKITEYNVLLDGQNFHNTPVSSQVKKYNEVRKVTTGKGYDYTTRSLMDYQYFKNHYQLIAVDLSKQKELYTDPRAIQQIQCYGKLEINSQVCTFLEKSKEF